MYIVPKLAKVSNVDYVTFWLNLYFYLIKTQQIILQLYLIYFNDCIISVKITFIYCINPIFQVSAPGGVLGYKCDGGGGGEGGGSDVIFWV